MPAQVLDVHDDALTCELMREILCLAGMQAVSLTDSAEVDRAQAVLESLNSSWQLEGEKFLFDETKEFAHLRTRMPPGRTI